MVGDMGSCEDVRRAYLLVVVVGDVAMDPFSTETEDVGAIFLGSNHKCGD